MNLKTIVPLVVALVLGVIAAKLGKDMMGKNHGAAGPGMKLAKLVVVQGDLAPGATIKDTDVALKDMPADAQSQYTFTSTQNVVGRVVATQLVKGQTVLDTLLAPTGSTGPGAIVPEGMRAVTLEVNEFSGVAGFLVPGSRVDVVQTMTVKGEDVLVAKAIVENLKILAVGRRTSSVPPAAGEAEPPARSVTLLATVEQAEAIDLASHVGSPRLVLRNGADGQVSNSKGVTVAALRGTPDVAHSNEPDPLNEALAQLLLKSQPTTKPAETAAKVEPAVKPKEYREVEVIRGGTSTSVRIGKSTAAADGSLTGSADKLLGEVPSDR